MILKVEPCQRKPDLMGFTHLGHKPCCAVTVDGYRFRKYIEQLYYLCSKSIGTDQLCGYHEADMRLCFCIYAKTDFLITWLKLFSQIVSEGRMESIKFMYA